MATYYGERGREKAQGLDWSAISEQLSGDLLKESQRREELRLSTEEDFQQSQKAMRELPQVKEKSVNEFILKSADEISMRNRTMYRQLKNGEINHNEYARWNQNIRDGYAHLKGVIDNFNTSYDEMLSRASNGEGHVLESWLGQNLEQLRALDDKTIYTGDDGTLYIGKINPDGTIDKNPNSYASVETLGSFMGVRMDAFNLDAATAESAKSAPKYIEAIGRGKVKTVQDFKKSPEFKTWLDNQSEYILSNPANAASVLKRTPHKDGVEYDFTRDPGDKDPYKIFVQVQDGAVIPQLTEAQQKVAKEIVEADIKAKMSRTEVAMPKATIGEMKYFTEQREKKKDRESIVNAIERLYSGGIEEQRAAAQFLSGKGGGKHKIVRRDGILYLVTPDVRGEYGAYTKGETIPITGNTLAEFGLSIGSQLLGMDFNEGEFNNNAVESAIDDELFVPGGGEYVPAVLSGNSMAAFNKNK